MLDEEGVERNPVPLGHHFPELRFGLRGSTRPDDAEAIRDSVNVGIDGDRRDPVAEHQDAVRGLGTNAGERDELVIRPGHDTAETREELLGDRSNDPGFRMVEAGRPDEGLDLGLAGPGQRPRVRKFGEQLVARPIGVLVPSPLREDRADQNLERVLRVVS